MADVNVTVGGDSSALDKEMRKAQVSVGKAAAGMGKGLSAAFGSSLGPLGELIEKISAMRAAVEGASLGVKLFALGTTALFAAVAAGVYAATEAWDKMRAAVDETNESTKRLNDSSKQIGETLSKGIASSQTGNAAKKLQNDLMEEEKALAKAKEWEGQSTLQRLTRSGDPLDVLFGADKRSSKDIEDSIAAKKAALADVLSGKAAQRGEENLYRARISPEAEKARNEANIQNAAKGLTKDGVAALKLQVQQLQDIVVNAPQTGAGAEQATAAQRSLEPLQAILKAATATGTQPTGGGALPISQLTSVGGRGGPIRMADLAKNQLEETKRQTKVLETIAANTNESQTLQ